THPAYPVPFFLPILFLFSCPSCYVFPAVYSKKNLLYTKHMQRINYLYFFIYFILLSFLCASSIFTNDSFEGSRFFFLFYSFGQAALETSILIFIGYTLQYFTPRKVFLGFIGATFLLFVLHVFDFMMERVLDLSVWETIAF